MRAMIGGALVALVAAGCGGKPTADVECVDNYECTGVQACIDNACVEVSCLSNDDCQVGQFCDPDGGWTCAEGCSRDTDCLAGQTCDDGTCTEGVCSNHHIDCEVGQTCSSGTCEDVEGFCQACTDGDESSCPDGWRCYWFEKEKESYCLQDCDRSGADTDYDAQCPARAECFGDEADSYCLIGCPDLVAGGML